MDVIDRFNDVMVANGVDASDAIRISELVRKEFCGGLIYVPKKSEAEKEKISADIRNNVRHDTIAKKYGISQVTVWRMSKKITRSGK